VTTEQGAAALQEFGFALVDLDQTGAPTPRRIANHIADIHRRLQDGLHLQSAEVMVLALAFSHPLQRHDATLFPRRRFSHRDGGAAS
jgi:hypothetical protein